jgi:hypothetical protein
VNATDDTPPLATTSAFERRLGEELTTLATRRMRHDAFPAPRVQVRWASTFRHGRRPLAVAAVVAATVAAVALPAVVSGPDGGSSAYAVTRDSDGTWRLELWQPGSLQPMVDKLRADGIPAVGLQETQEQAEACQSRFPSGSSVLKPEHRPGDAPGTVRIDPSQIRPGSTVVLLSETAYQNGKLQWSLLTGRVMDTVPPCFSNADLGVKFGSTRPVARPTGAIPTTPAPAPSVGGSPAG